MSKPRVIILVSRGAVVGVYANQKIDIQLIDHDDLQRCETKKEIMDSVSKREVDIVSNDAELNNIVGQEIVQAWEGRGGSHESD